VGFGSWTSDRGAAIGELQIAVSGHQRARSHHKPHINADTAGAGCRPGREAARYRPPRRRTDQSQGGKMVLLTTQPHLACSPKPAQLRFARRAAYRSGRSSGLIRAAARPGRRTCAATCPSMTECGFRLPVQPLKRPHAGRAAHVRRHLPFNDGRLFLPGRGFEIWILEIGDRLGTRLGTHF